MLEQQLALKTMDTQSNLATTGNRRWPHQVSFFSFKFSGGSFFDLMRSRFLRQGPSLLSSSQLLSPRITHKVVISSFSNWVDFKRTHYTVSSDTFHAAAYYDYKPLILNFFYFTIVADKPHEHAPKSTHPNIDASFSQ